MKTENIEKTQNLPVMISDAAWQSMLPFLRACRNVYVGNPETCRRFLSALVWITKQGATWRAWFRKPMGIGILFIDASGDGAMPGSLKDSMNTSMMRVKSLRSLLIRQSCGHIHRQRVLRKKNGGQVSAEALGRSPGGFTTKLNAAVSGTFLPLRFILTENRRTS